jgi:hypothetical protein
MVQYVGSILSFLDLMKDENVLNASTIILLATCIAIESVA